MTARKVDGVSGIVFTAVAVWLGILAVLFSVLPVDYSPLLSATEGQLVVVVVGGGVVALAAVIAFGYGVAWFVTEKVMK